MIFTQFSAMLTLSSCSHTLPPHHQKKPSPPPKKGLITTHKAAEVNSMQSRVQPITWRVMKWNVARRSSRDSLFPPPSLWPSLAPPAQGAHRLQTLKRVGGGTLHTGYVHLSLSISTPPFNHLPAAISISAAGVRGGGGGKHIIYGGVLQYLGLSLTDSFPSRHH